MFLHDRLSQFDSEARGDRENRIIRPREEAGCHTAEAIL